MTGETELQVSLGFATRIGRRRRNEDFAGACLGTPTERAEMGIVAALSDGMGGAKGGREAAEVAVRGFLEGYYQQTPTLGVRHAASRVVQCLNSWLAAQGKADQTLAGMGATFTALVVKGRNAHVVHVGDSRLYRFSNGRLTRLTEDHALKQPGLTHVLYRALGIEDVVRLDYSVHPVLEHDRFMLCSDGVHGPLPDLKIAEILDRRSSSDETADALVSAALEAGGDDNATALVVDVIGLPLADPDGIGRIIDALPMRALPQVGESVDGYRLTGILSDGRYSRLFKALDVATGSKVVLKFPHPSVAAEATYKSAFMREAWVTARVQSPFVAAIVDHAEGRQTCLYTVMTHYEGETLERRLLRRPAIGLAEGKRIALDLGKAVAALHRVGIIHRDIKPENVILEEGGGLRLLDLGVVRVPGMEEFPAADIPGTPSYMAPEMFDGDAGTEKSDLFALGATLYRMFTQDFPFGEIEPFSRPRWGKVPSLSKARPDLPPWLDALIRRALSQNPDDRPDSVLEFLWELESGPTQGNAASRRKRPLYDRNPLLVWKLISAGLFVALAASLIHKL